MIVSLAVDSAHFSILQLIVCFLQLAAFVSTPIDAGWKVTAEDVGTLKKTLIQVFTETFCKQLIATTQDQASTDKSFVEALLRRIKHLIQFVPVK